MIPPAIRWLEVKETGKYGQGVFAKADFKAGEVIHVFGGVRFSAKEFVERLCSGNGRLDDPLQIGKRTYLDLDDFSRRFNHSCDPNAGMRKTCEIFAIRDIRRGEEIVYDYSLTVAPTEWEMKCRCGSARCRKIVGDIRSVPPGRLEQYKKLGALQDYMKALLRDAKRNGWRIPDYERKVLAQLKAVQDRR